MTPILLFCGRLLIVPNSYFCCYYILIKLKEEQAKHQHQRDNKKPDFRQGQPKHLKECIKHTF